MDTSKKADQLENGKGLLVERDEGLKEVQLQVFVQVNTSGEAEKAGVELRETSSLCKYIIQNCSRLKLHIARSNAIAECQESEKFVGFKEVMEAVADELGIELELSLGFESAMRCGSDEVRLGRELASSMYGGKPDAANLSFFSKLGDFDPKPHKSELSWRL